MHNKHFHCILANNFAITDDIISAIDKIEIIWCPQRNLLYLNDIIDASDLNGKLDIVDIFDVFKVNG